MEQGHAVKDISGFAYGINAGNQLVQHDGRWHVFYTGVNSAHNGKQSYGKPRQVIMDATADSAWS